MLNRVFDHFRQSGDGGFVRLQQLILASASGPDIGGTIAIESRTRIDLDTADDVFAGKAVSGEVVSLPDGAVAAGYLSNSGGFYRTDTADNFEYYRDVEDTYAASLATGDSVVIQLFGSPTIFFPELPLLNCVSRWNRGGRRKNRRLPASPVIPWMRLT